MKMRTRLVAVFVVACMALGCMAGIACAQASAMSVKVKTTQDYKIVQQIFKNVNKQRAKRGLVKLKLDKSLSAAATKRAAEVAIMVPFSSPHMRPNGSRASSISSRVIYECCAEGNGYTNGKEVVTDWMNSPPHKRGILLSNARSIGISFISSGTGQVATLEFSDTKVKKKLTKKKGKVSKTYKVKGKSKYLKKSHISLMSYDEFYGLTEPDTVWENCTLIPMHTSKYHYFDTELARTSFKWKSSKPSVATVSKKGKLKLKKNGTVTITATMKNNPKIKAKVKLYVEM